jgi:hypothetical protein
MTDRDHIDAHKFCRNNRDSLKNDTVCGCFHCTAIFSPAEITDWLPEKKPAVKEKFGENDEWIRSDNPTAFCPFCGIDSVIGESSGYPITKEFMQKMYDHWFRVVYTRQINEGVTRMKKTLIYPYPVTNWDIYNVSDCFGSLYMFLEKMSAEKVDYYCAKQEKGDCYGCAHSLCRDTGFSPARIHEVLYHTFETFTGTNSAINAFKRESKIRKEIRDTDDTIDFIMKYTGYNYVKYTDKIATSIQASINADTPVLARLTNNRFRIIIGYDDSSPIALEKDGNRTLADGEIAAAYVITGKTERTLHLADALKRIKYVLDRNREECIWDEYIAAFTESWDKLENENVEATRDRFLQLREVVTWWCHSFAETFRHKIFAELKDERLAKSMDEIDAAYDDSHTAGWQAHALYNFRDWSKPHSHSEWGYWEIAADIARRLKKDDERVYAAVTEMIDIIEKGERK